MEFKDTELGPIPVDWEVRRLGDCGEWIGGGTPSTQNTEYWNGRIPWISSSDLKEGNIYHVNKTRFISESAVRNSATSKCPQGALLIIARVGVGKVAIADTELCTSQDFSNLMVDDKMDVRFLAYLLSVVMARMKEATQGTSIKGVSLEDLKALVMIRPPTLSEQRRIAKALGDVDRLIENLKKRIEKKRNIKRGAMQELLAGKRRLKGFTGEWVEKRLGEMESDGLVKLYRGKVISKLDIIANPGNCPIYSSSVINDGLMGRYGDYMFDEELISWSIDGGGNFFYRHKHKFSVTNVCGYMRVNAKLICCRYLAYELQYLHSFKTFDYQTKAHPSVIRKEYALLLPPLSEQRAIAEVLSDMDGEIANLEAKLKKLMLLKQGMMQDLLTGKVRLV